MVSIEIVALAIALTSAGETTLLDFQAPCAPCRAMEGTVTELQAAGYPVRKIDTDRDRALAVQHNVQSIPCFVLLVDGQEAGRLTGAVRRAELLALYHNAGVKPKTPGGAIARTQSPDPPGVAMPAEMDRNPLVASRGAQTAGDASGGSRAGARLQDLILASVRLTVEDPEGVSHGSGTLIDARQGEALVLTCGHIFRDSQGKGRILIDLFGPHAPQKVPGRLVSYDLKNDIGLVSIRPGVPVTVAPVAPAGQPIARGDQVVTVGCNNGGPATALESKITAIDKFLGPPNLQVAGVPVQGRSGGGLFTSDGQVIGVCNAADPTDHEGLYAALATIHQQLDRAGLSSVYQNRPARTEPSLAAAAPGPTMPARMPAANALPGVARQVAAQVSSAAGDPSAALNDAERMALAEMSKRGDSAEVICIVRPLTDPRAKSEVIKLDRASAALLRQLAADRAAQESRQLTVRELPAQQIDPPSSR